MNTFEFFDSDYFKTGLNLTSLGDTDAARRMQAYSGALDNLETLRQINQRMKTFDDLNAVDNTAPSAMGVALAEASIKANIQSIAGSIAVERSMTQMNQLMIYRDIITKAGASVMPNVGPDNPRSRANKIYSANLTVGATAYTVTLDAVVPGSIAITLKEGTSTYNMIDDRNGNILTQTGVISAGTINYSTGALALTLVTAPVAGDTIKICYGADQSQAEGTNRTTLKQGYYQLNAKINKYEFEADLITAAISQKTLGGDIVKELQDGVQDERTIAINNQLCTTIKNSYAGDTLTIDLSAFSVESGFADSLLKVFNMGLQAINSAIARRCYKAVAANAYIVGNNVATQFMNLEDAQGFVMNNTGYVNAIIGYYKSVPVIRNLELDPNEGYALYKTADIAAVSYGMLLPATALPLTGNFLNTEQIAGGIYSVDGVAPMCRDLAQRFVVSFPTNWFVQA